MAPLGKPKRRIRVEPLPERRREVAPSRPEPVKEPAPTRRRERVPA
jgi:hypothetical protein